MKYNKKKDTEITSESRLCFLYHGEMTKDLLGSFDAYEAHYNSVQTSLIPIKNEYEHNIEELELARQMMEDEQK